MSGLAPGLDERSPEVAGLAEVGEVVGRTQWQLFWERFREDRVALVALGFVAVEVLLALFAPVTTSSSRSPSRFGSGRL